MTRAVYIGETGLLCARGDSPDRVAEALWSGECASGRYPVGDRHFPYFLLPLTEADWAKRAETAIHCVAEPLGDLASHTPLFVASSSFQIGFFEQQGAPFDLPAAAPSFSREIAAWMGLTGPHTNIASACISGFSSIDAARNLIATGLLDEAIVVGFELANRCTLAGFASMELLSSTACRPLDARRDGLVLGEAVAAVRLTAKRTRWRIASLTTGIDAHSMTGPDPAGGPIARLMVDCLNEARFKSGDIDLIKLQAAGSPGSDLAEANALRQVFGQAMPQLLTLKPAFGHTLGASGVAELAALLACLNADRIPATQGFSKVDPEIALFPAIERSTAHVERAMLNLIGFGGGLASLIVERQP